MKEGNVKVVARLELAGCPEGIVLRNAEPDTSVEQRFFADWVNACTIPGHVGSWRQFCVVRESDSGRVALEHSMKDNGCILAGAEEWQDYTIEATMRQFLASTLPNEDHELNLTGRTGIVFRVQTTRRYYHFCMEGYERFVLYRRKDESWTELASRNRPVDRRRYYNLRVTATGPRLRCFIDGELAFEVDDDAYARGKAGWHTNTLARLENLTVSMPQEAHDHATRTRQEKDRNAVRLRERFPQMKLAQEQAVGPCRILDVASGPGGTMLLLSSKLDTGKFLYGKHDRNSAAFLRGVRLDGRTIWQSELPEAVYPGSVVGDLRGDGRAEVALTTSQRLYVLNVETGRERCSIELPHVGPHMLGRRTMLRGSKCSPGRLYMLQLQPPPAPRSILLMEDSSGGGNTLWAYDHELKLQWTVTLPQPSFGHVFGWWDVDGDGCDEVLAGYTLLDHDGRVLWRVEGCEYFDCYLGGRHPDITYIGKLDGREPSAVIAGGPDGALFVDVNTGRIKARHRIGHAQHVMVGNFRPERAGSEAWMFNAWGNFGILTLFSGAGEELFQCQPTYLGPGIQTVRNWAGDGQDLLLVWANDGIFGLWDGEGNTVVPMPSPYDRRRDPLQFLAGFPQLTVTDVNADGRDELLLLDEEVLRIYSR